RGPIASKLEIGRAGPTSTQYPSDMDRERGLDRLATKSFEVKEAVKDCSRCAVPRSAFAERGILDSLFDFENRVAKRSRPACDLAEILRREASRRRGRQGITRTRPKTHPVTRTY